MKNFYLKGYGSIKVVEGFETKTYLFAPKEASLKAVIHDAVEYVSWYSKEEIELRFENGITLYIKPGMTAKKAEEAIKNKLSSMLHTLNYSDEETPRGPQF